MCPVTESHGPPEASISHWTGDEVTKKRNGGRCLSWELKCKDPKGVHDEACPEWRSDKPWV